MSPLDRADFDAMVEEAQENPPRNSDPDAWQQVISAISKGKPPELPDETWSAWFGDVVEQAKQGITAECLPELLALDHFLQSMSWIQIQEIGRKK